MAVDDRTLPPIPAVKVTLAAGCNPFPIVCHRRKICALEAGDVQWPELAPRETSGEDFGRRGHVDQRESACIKEHVLVSPLCTVESLPSAALEPETHMSSQNELYMSQTDSAKTTRGQDVTRAPNNTEFLRLSDRAVAETAYAHMLPCREFSIGADGVVMLEGEVAPPTSFDLADIETKPECVEAWKRSRSLAAEILVLRKALLDHFRLDDFDGHGSGRREPCPSPVRKKYSRRRISSRDIGFSNDCDLSQRLESRYQQISSSHDLPASGLARHALSAIGKGGSELPQEFSVGAYMGNRCAEAFFRAIAEEFRTLDGASARLGEEVALKSLDFARQGLGNEAAVALSNILPLIPSLLELKLTGNHISEKGAVALYHQVLAHPHLRYVHLEMNPVPSWIRVKMEEFLANRRAADICHESPSEAKTTLTGDAP